MKIKNIILVVAFIVGLAGTVSCGDDATTTATTTDTSLLSAVAADCGGSACL